MRGHTWFFEMMEILIGIVSAIAWAYWYSGVWVRFPM